MRKIISLGVAVLAVALAPFTAQASDRYGQKPPVILSPDLSAPWVVQLQGTGAQRVVRTQAPRVVVRTPRVIQRQQPVIRQAAVQAKPRKPAARSLDPMWLPQVVDYQSKYKAGTIIVDTNQRFLFLVLGDGKARRYGVGVGKPGFEWAGTHKVTRKAVWPDWRPPASMIKREKAKGRILPTFVKGGPENPLGARALYLGSTLYRIHGTNAPWTIGRAVSSGCIRMRNEDVTDLYERVKVGVKVIVI